MGVHLEERDPHVRQVHPEEAEHFGQKRASCGSELHAASNALEQRRADLALEIADLTGERRLRDVEPRGSPSEVKLFGDGDQVPEVAEFHLTYKVSRLTNYVLDCRPGTAFITGVQTTTGEAESKHGYVRQDRGRARMKPYLLVSDFDQTLSFNDSGRRLSELLGIGGFDLGDGSSDLHVMLHVNRGEGLTIAVSQVRRISEIARRTVMSDDALSVLVPVLEEIAGYGTPEIRALFDRHGFVIQEWEKVRTDWLTVREHGVAEHEPPMAVIA